MPKLKTHKGAKKRFKVTGGKKIVHSKAYKSHILTKKSAKRKRNLRKKDSISQSDRGRIKDMLPYDI
ncbi:MAG: 50S ribosomal protein L35 [Candidatus Aminicenantes bacterium]|nr:50S ribosomal protein L35 [Candidatus Aminicenantes bacterium]MDH5385299.1 50S ribosomal protein L35 [Candidatus Aminicenantes bacterium]MDH5742366.1 50S ribosomal protein L35 [Candidatus Aminicenantes bacterium]